MLKNITFFFLLLGPALIAQDYSQFNSTVEKITALSKIDDATQREAQTAELWKNLLQNKSIPFVQEDSVAFLYRGKAKSVSWMGDFNGWGYNKNFHNKGTQIHNTDIWILKTSFPKDARLDYKILIDGRDWIIDQANPHQQWSGVGGGSPNSELRMPLWKPDPITIAQSGVPKGVITNDILFYSNALGYQVTYSVYLPVGYSSSQKYPVIYVTDGYEYTHERMGNMPIILDNLIAQKKIQPIIAIFIDHREPVNRSNNRRMQELAMNSKYLTFFEQEFIPHVESQHAVLQDANQRAILGTSMGGLTAAYFAFTKPGIFGMTGIQSPSFKYKPEIFTVCDNPENPPVKVFMTTGVVNDAEVEARRMKGILEKNLCTFQYTETNQGHSWGNFRDSIDEILIYFFPSK